MTENKVAHPIRLLASPAIRLPSPGLAWRLLAARLSEVRGQLFPFAPVMIGIGIGIWFAMKSEPMLGHYAVTALCAALCLALRLRGPEGVHLPALACGLCLAGFLAAGVRAHMVAAPVLSFRYYGPIEGRIVMIDRSYSDQIRLTLDHVVLDRVSPDRTPAQVRVALHGDDPSFSPEPGATVILSGHLSPPDGPVAPDGFDFQRLAWYEGLGGVGYTRSPVLVLEPATTGLWWYRLRMRLSAAMQAEMPGQAGAMASAFMTGDRSGIDAATNDAMRAANLSHLISISGLHMGLLTGFVFAALRYGLALMPPLALRINSRKLAAGVSLAAATFYLLLAGPNVATERAYVMAAVMLVAVLFDRRAMSLRSVALAGVILLLIEPESLIEPGFQMSFSATVALVAGFEALRKPMQRLPGWVRPVVLAVAASFIAGTATTPYAAAHFNRIAEYGLVANLIVTPIMAFVVMPAGVIAAILGLVGLEWLPLLAMDWGTGLVITVAQTVSAWKGAVLPVPAPGPWVLPALTLGALWLAIWPGRARLAGVLPIALAALLWVGAERPLLLIAQDGGLVGLMGPEGRALSKEKGGGFIADTWLEDDGDAADRLAAATRAGFTGPQKARAFSVAGTTGLHLSGKSGPEAALLACGSTELIVLNTDLPEAAAQSDCLIFDPLRLRQTGAIAFYADAASADPMPGLRMITARQVSGDRLWNTRSARRAENTQ